MRGYLAAKENISVIESVADSVRAMEQAAASHVHRLRGEVMVREGYFLEVAKVLGLFARHYQVEEHKFFSKDQRDGKRVLVVVFGDRGLVGGLYNRLTEKAAEVIENYDEVVVMGEYGEKKLVGLGVKPEKIFGFSSETVDASVAREVSSYLTERYLTDGVQSDVLYASFDSFTVQHVRVRNYLPITVMPAYQEAKDRPIGFPIIDPNRHRLADELLKRYLDNFFLALLSDAKLSELASRTVAMEHASSQAEEKVGEAKHKYFKERRREVSRRQIESFFAHLSV